MQIQNIKETIKILSKNKPNLLLNDFMKEMNYNIDEIYINKFWHSLDNNIWIYVDKTLGKWMELYDENEGMKIIYRSVKKYLNNDEYLIYTNFEDFNNNYLKSSQTQESGENLIIERGNRSKYLIVKPSSFKKWGMRIRTNKGDEICEYYIKLEEIFHNYLYYQNECQNNFKDNRIHNLETLMLENNIKFDHLINITKDIKDQNNILINKTDILEQKLDIATEDRVVKPMKKCKTERFVILRLGDINEEFFNYYSIRAQKYHVNSQIKKYKKVFPNLATLVDIECQPNSRNLFIRMKEQLTKYMEFDGNDFNIIHTNEQNFIQMVMNLNDDKKNV